MHASYVTENIHNGEFQVVIISVIISSVSSIKSRVHNTNFPLEQTSENKNTKTRNRYLRRGMYRCMTRVY